MSLRWKNAYAEVLRVNSAIATGAVTAVALVKTPEDEKTDARNDNTNNNKSANPQNQSRKDANMGEIETTPL